MFENCTDAHCHIGGVSAPFEAAVCAINAAQWRDLKNAENPKIKKTFGFFLGEAIDIPEAQMQADMKSLSDFLGGAAAVGEFGLDKRFSEVLPFYKQEIIFDAHIELASAFALPCVLHCVGAWGFLLKKVRAAKRRNGALRFLLHSASCSPDLARDFQKLGCYFSFSPRQLASKNGAALAHSAEAERILLESDDVPNAETYARALRKIAELRNMRETELSDIVYSNFHAFYSKK